MEYNDIDPAVRTYIGYHEGFRKLGFKSDDIYIQTAQNGMHRSRGMYAFGILKGKTDSGEDRTFIVECGRISRSVSDFEAHAQSVMQAIVDGSVSAEVLDRIWQESEAHTRALQFIHAIHAKGISIPRVDVIKHN